MNAIVKTLTFTTVFCPHKQIQSRLGVQNKNLITTEMTGIVLFLFFYLNS